MLQDTKNRDNIIIDKNKQINKMWGVRIKQDKYDRKSRNYRYTHHVQIQNPLHASHPNPLG